MDRRGIAGGALVIVVLVLTGRMTAPVAVLPLLCGGAAGALYDMQLSTRVKARRTRMTDELPTTLEFLALCLSAGEGFLDALRRVSSVGSGELTGEFRQVVLAVGTGSPLAEALSETAARLQLPGLSRAIDQVIADTDAMFTEPSALERLIDRKQSDSTANMLSNALAQGGRGTFVADQAVDLADVVARGFDAAAQVEFEPTAEAVTAIEHRLGGPQAWRMNRVLQAVWEGSEGSLTQFPGGADTSGRLNPESLRYLVKYMRTDDEGFWKRVGRGLRLSDLETLDFDTDSDNIQRLVKANLDVIAARAVVVKSDPLGLDSAAEGELFRWARRGRHIRFEAPNLFAILGGAKKDLDDAEKDAAQAVSVERFIERSDSFDLIEVSVHSGPEHISAKIDEGAISTERLRGLSATFEGAGEVAQSIVSTRSGRVNVDLAERTGTGVTRSKILMADLVATTIPLVYDLPEEYRDALAEFLAYEKDDGQTPVDMSELDDEDEDGNDEDYGVIDPDTGEIAAFPGETIN